jgi:outer membrane biosynthesis protein TonB
MKFENTPIEVSITDEVGLESQAPVASHEEAAALKAPEEGPPVPDTPPPADTPPEPTAKPQPIEKPAPAPDAAKMPPAKPTTAAVARPQPRNERRPTGALDGLDIGVTDKPSDSRAATPPAAAVGAEARSALIAEISRQLRPHWKSPSGADVDKLRTVVEVHLDQSGAIVGDLGPCKQIGTVTPSNRPQVDLHCENARRAIRLASPFKLPPNLYGAWKTIAPVFDKRLSL